MLTWLYVPGDRPDRFAKALASGADTVVVDLQDAVAPGRKAYARDTVREFLATPQPVPVTVRINGPADLDAIAGLPGLAGLRVPDVRAVDDVERVAVRAPGIPLHLTIESAIGVERAYAIASASAAVEAIGLGEADLSSDLGVTDESGLLWARGRIVLAARAAGLPSPAMSVYPNVSDLDGLARSCVSGRGLGFLGRAAIHPRQLPVIVAAFLPQAAEVDRALEVLDALDAAAARGEGGAVLPDGRFVDRAMADGARRVVAIAKRHG
jgi:citrate lyase subunit beta/citryl-CoA lyase